MKKAVTFLLTLLMIFLSAEHSEAQLAMQNYADAPSFSFYEEVSAIFKGDSNLEETYTNENFEEQGLSENENSNVLTPLTDANIQIAVDDWVANPTTATTTYGHISGWDVSAVTDMSSLFYNKTTFNDDISSWDVSNVTNMRSMFREARDFNKNIGAWNVGKVTNMDAMFRTATVFNQDIGSWDVSNVTGMLQMFRTATAFNQDLSNWCVTLIASEPFFFANSSALQAANKPVWGTCPVVVTPPTLTTTAAAIITATTADLAGDITAGSETITERGIVYAETATNANPEIGGTGVTTDDNGSGAGVFTETITGLTASTGYSYRAYATTTSGTTYGSVLTFNTLAAVNLPTTLNFDGVDDYVDIGQVIPSNVSYTKESWVYLETILNARNVVSSLNAPFWINQGVLSSSNNFQGGGAAVNIASPNTLAINTWIHVAVTYDGATLKLYEDGVLVAEQLGAPSYTAENMHIGTFIPGTLSLDGNIDEVRIWNTARSCDEIVAYKDIELAGNETGLVAYYDFNQGALNADNTTVTTLLDKQTNGALHNGTLTNFTLTGVTSNWVDGSANGVTTGTPSIFPEINIVGNSVAIVDGDTTPDVSDDTDFGSVIVSENDTHTFTIQNTGTADLTGITISKSGIHQGEFTINGAPTAITAGQTATFTVTFAPANGGLRTLDLTVNSNDCDEAAYSIKLQGTGVAITTPSVTTVSVDNTSEIGFATFSGDITSDGGDSLTEMGVVFSLTSENANPEIGGTGVQSRTKTPTQTGTFTLRTGTFTEGVAYSYRIYATNSIGTSYGNVLTFTTLTPPTFTSASTASFTENTDGIAYTAAATDNNSITYSLGVNGDESLFTVDSNTGVVRFVSAPNFESPSDSDTNNTYVIEVIASDGNSSTSQTVTITVTDAFEDAISVQYPTNGLIGHWIFEGRSQAEAIKDITGHWDDLTFEGTGATSVISAGLDLNDNGYAQARGFKGQTIESKTLITYVTLQDLSVTAGSAITLDDQVVDNFDAIVFSEQAEYPNQWRAGSSNFSRNTTTEVGVLETQANQQVQIAVAYNVISPTNMEITMYRNGVLVGSYTDDDSSSWPPATAEMLFGVRHTLIPNANGNAGFEARGSLDAIIGRAMIYNRALSAGEIASITGIIDTTPPTVAVSTTSDDPTNTSPIPVTITFSEAVVGFTVNDITITGATLSDFATADNIIFTANAAPTGTGTVSISVAAAATADAAGVGNTVSNTLEIGFDAAEPVFTSGTAVDFTENASGVAYTIVATDDGEITYSLGSGNDEASFTINGAEVSFVSSPDFETKASYTINVIATDALSNAANQYVVITILDVDEVAPTVTIASIITGPTDTNPIPVTVAFSETVTGFDASDISVSGGAIQNFAGTEADYTFNLVPSGDGTLTVDIAADVAQDGAGNNNTVATQFTIDYAGTPATALNFDGTNDYVNIGNVLPSNSAYTKEVWVFLDQNKVSHNIISSPRSPFYILNNKLAVTNNHGAGGGPGTQFNLFSPNTLPQNIWIHVAVTWDGTTMSLYENGVLAASNTGHTSYTGENTTIGAFYVNNNALHSFGGDMDEVRIWNVAKTASQISANKDTELNGDETGLVAYYDFNQGIAAQNNTSENTLLDRQTNIGANNGQLQNFALTGTSSNWVNGTANGVSEYVAPPVFTSATAIDFTENASGVTYTIAATHSSAITYSLGSGNDETSFTLNGAEVSFNASPDFETKASYTINVIATDALDNASNQDVVITILDEDEVPPTVTIASIITGPTDTNPIPVTVAFSETVTGFDASDITVSGGSVQNFAGTEADYSFDLVPSGNGTITVDIAADVAQDGAGNNNLIASQFSIEYSSLTPITQQNIYAAVALWESNPTFAEATYGHISNWDVSAVTDMNALFLNKVTFNDDISGWDVSNVTNMASMFFGATNFNQAIGSWNVSNVENMSSMFYEAINFNQAIGSWNVSKVENMAAMFWIATNFNQDISSWNVSSVLDMSIMFWNAINFNQDIGSWNVSQVTTMNAMFSGASNFNQDLSSWDVSQVTNMNAMFWSATNFNQNIRSWCVPLIVVEPSTFSTSSGLHNLFKPVWGRCPNAIAVSTASAASITLSSAVLSGSITDLGANAILEKGIILSDVNQNPTILGSATVKFTDITPGTGINITRTDFTPESTIYFRTYVIDVYNVTYYGNVQSFTTSAHVSPSLTSSVATGVTLTNAVLEGTIITTGTRTVSEKGILLSSINTSPTVSESDVEKDVDTGAGSLIRSIRTDLDRATTYYFRTYLTDTNNTTYYGDVVSFTTLSSTVATVLTTAVSNVDLNSATFAGNATEDGDASGGISERGIIYVASAINTNPEINGTGVIKNDNGSGTGTFSESITGLTAGTQYSYRAYAVNTEGTAYGNVFTFKTASAELETTDASNIATTSAMFAGKVLNAGGNSFTEKGVVFSISGINNDPKIGGTGVTQQELTYENGGYFMDSAIGLVTNTAYSYKSYAISSNGITYGPLKTFTTDSAFDDQKIGQWDFEGGSTSDSTGNWGDLNLGNAEIVNGKLDVDNGDLIKTTSYSGNSITTITLVSFAEIQNLNVRSGSILSMDGKTTDNFNAIVYAERQANRWMNGSTYYRRTQDLNPGFAESTPNTPVMMAITYAETPSGINFITVYRNGVNIGSYFTPGIKSNWPANNVEVLFGARHSNPNAIGGIDALIDKAIIYDRALSPTELNSLYQNSFEKPTVVTSAASAIDITTVTFNGDVTSNGGTSITERGFVYSETLGNGSPEIDGNEVEKVVSTDGLGVFNENISGLSGGTEYSYRAYATNDLGTTYGDILTFTTSNPSAPTVITNTVSLVTAFDAVFSSNVTDDGGADIEDVGILLAETSVNSDPIVTDTNVIKVGVEDITTFTETIKHLKPNTQYTYKAYADNDTEFGYGTALMFTTLATTGTVVTGVAQNIQETSAEFLGEATDNGGGTISETGIVYAITTTNPNPEIGGTGVTKEANGNTLGTFSETISSLINGTQYSYRAYIINGEGTSYGEVLIFTTIETPPAGVATIATTAAQVITQNSVVIAGDISSNNGAAVTARGIVFAKTSVTTLPTIGDNGVFDVTIGSGTGAFNTTATGLEASTEYVYRAYATNSVGTVYGDVVTFTTSALATFIPSGLIGHWDFENGSISDKTGNWSDLILNTNTNIVNGKLDLNAGSLAYTGSYSGSTIKEKTLVSYVELQDLGVRAGSVLTIDGQGRTDNFDAIVFAERQVNRWMAGSSYFRRTINPTPGFAETTTGEKVMMAITYKETSNGQASIKIYRNGVEIGRYTKGAIATWSSSNIEVLFGARHTLPAMRGSVDALVDEAMIFNRPLSESEILSLYQNSINTTLVTTTSVHSIGNASGVFGGNVLNDGGDEITDRGIVYAEKATNASPEIDGTGVTKVQIGSGTEAFGEKITDFMSSTTYTYRAYAINSKGTVYGEIEEFTTLDIACAITPDYSSVNQQAWRYFHGQYFVAPCDGVILSLSLRSSRANPNIGIRIAEEIPGYNREIGFVDNLALSDNSGDVNSRSVLDLSSASVNVEQGKVYYFTFRSLSENEPIYYTDDNSYSPRGSILNGYLHDGGDRDLVFEMEFGPQQEATDDITTFNAGATNSFADARNWDKGKPGENASIAVKNGVVMTVDQNDVELDDFRLNEGATLDIPEDKEVIVNGEFNTDGSLSLDSNGDDSGVLFIKGTTSGTITYKRGGLFANKWSVISAPVSGQKVVEFAQNADNDIRTNTSVSPVRFAIGYYDDNQASKWNYFNANTPVADTFEIGKSYSMSRATDGEVTFIGTLEVGNVNQSVNVGEWQAIGNPYTTYLAANKNESSSFLEDNFALLDDNFPALYIWDNAQSKYVAVTQIDAANRSIPPGQGFFIRTKSTANVVFNQDKRQLKPTEGTTTFNKSTNPEMILYVSDGASKVKTNIKYFANATKGFDVGYDFGNFGSSQLDVYSHLVEGSVGVDYTIQSLSLNDIENVSIPIGFTAKTGKEITFSLNKTGLSEGLNIYLEDKLLNTLTSLTSSDDTYKVTISEDTNGIGRFYLRTSSKALSNDDFSINENISMYTTTNNDLKIVGLPTGHKASIKLFNVLGKEIETFIIDGAEIQNTINLNNFSAGVYFVNIKSNRTTVSKKIIIK